MALGGAQTPLDPGVPEASDVRIQQQLDRVLRSGPFHHSAQHRALLAYLVRESLRGHAGDLKEYSVGIDALGKPPGYNVRQDATARIQTGRLRIRLEEYYRTEGVTDPVVFTIPKGGFKVLFRNRSEVEVAGNTRTLRRVCIGLAVLLAAAIGLSAWLATALSHSRSTPRLAASVWTPELETIWRHFIDNDRPLTLSLGTPLFFDLGGVAVRRWGENRWQEGQLPPVIQKIRDALSAPEVRPFYAYNTFGETVGAIRLQRLFLARGKDLSFRRSNDLTWNDFKDRDLILLGSPKSVLHLKYSRDISANLVFTVEVDRIVNDDPRPGEAAFYPAVTRVQDAAYDGYALVTRLPGIQGTGNIMILGSPDAEGTLAACEYVSSPKFAKDLIREFAPGGNVLPAAYQVLLKATFRADVPLAIKSIAHRELKLNLATQRP